MVRGIKMAKNIEQVAEITSFPYDEGKEAARKGISFHKNPYKSPNTAKTDDVKSEAWLRGFGDYKSIYTPI